MGANLPAAARARSSSLQPVSTCSSSAVAEKHRLRCPESSRTGRDHGVAPPGDRRCRTLPAPGAAAPRPRTGGGHRDWWRRRTGIRWRNRREPRPTPPAGTSGDSNPGLTARQVNMVRSPSGVTRTVEVAVAPERRCSAVATPPAPQGAGVGPTLLVASHHADEQRGLQNRLPERLAASPDRASCWRSFRRAGCAPESAGGAVHDSAGDRRAAWCPAARRWRAPWPPARGRRSP